MECNYFPPKGKYWSDNREAGDVMLLDLLPLLKKSCLFIVLQIEIPLPNLKLEFGNMDLNLDKPAGSAAIHSKSDNWYKVPIGA